MGVAAQRTVAAGSPDPPPRRSEALLDRTDLLPMVGLMALGLVARVVWRSGWGLGDDVLYRHFIYNILNVHIIPADNTSYRVAWWFPTALACRVFGMSEVGMILPITLIDTLAIGLLYAFGKALWGREGGVIAALLVVVCPLDFAWSTMLASDFFISFFTALTFLCILRTFAHEDAAAKRRLWAAAAVALLLAYHSKVSAVLLAPPIAFICLRRWRDLGRPFLTFLGTAVVLFGVSALVAYVIAGDPLAPYHSEISFQGLQGDVAIQFHRLTENVFWLYPRWLFYPNAWGNRFYSLYPHLVVAFVLVGWLFGLRSSLDVAVWLVVVFLGMQFNMQNVNGVWVSGFRNVRHLHVVVYPMVLMLTGYLVTLHRRLPRTADVFFAALVAFSAWQSVSTATKTHVAFADRRNAVHYLMGLPQKTVYSDFQINTWASIVSWEVPFKELEGFDRRKRRQEIAAIDSGYLVTGGAREPYYGCIDCIPLAEEISGPQWHLLREFPGPKEPLAWRPEPLRIWEASR